jgi:signal transduction histidine kinase
MTNTQSDSGETAVSRRRRRGSLFFKLVAVMLGTVFLTMVLLGFFFRTWWNPDVRESTRLNVRQYAELLTREIGTPPDFEKARHLSEKLSLGVAIRDPQGAWWFSPIIPDAIRERIQSRPVPDSVRVFYRNGRMVAVIPQDGHIFVFGSRRRQPLENGLQEWLLIFAGLPALWLLAWLFLRRQLQPVRELARGVKAVESGNLDTHIPETGSNELANLAVSFNAMTRSMKERLRARDQLLLDVSHELRSPLTRMRVALEMAEPGSAVDSLHEEVDALGKMVSEMLETERLNSQAGGLRREPADLDALLAEKVTRFEGIGPGIGLSGRVGRPVPMDIGRMRLVLRNLLENAIKHGAGSERPVLITAREFANHAVIEIRNGGPIVPEEEQRLIFEPFYRTDRSRSGTPGYGLGLPLCKRIVEAHGGTIAFRSNTAEGTVVTIRLPMA